MTTKKNIIITALVFLSSLAQADDFETKVYKELAERSGVKEEIPGVKDQRKMEAKGLLSSVPDGLSFKDMSPACDPRRFEESVIGHKISNRQYYTLAKRYFEKCGNELTSKGSTGLMGLLKFAYVEYPFLENSKIHEFKLKVTGGRTVPAILALKDDPRPRPMVVIRCGVFCAAEPGASMKSYMMHLFDQAPFNVLLLGSQTGADYVTKNGVVTLGGWAEGFETMEVGKWLVEKWEYRDRISSLHMIGVSLGGNTAVMDAAFNDKYPLDNGKKLFNSVTAVCPVVRLKPTLDYLYSNGLVGAVFSDVTRNHFKTVRPYVKDVPELLTDEKIPSNTKAMPEFIGTLASTGLVRRGIASTPESFFRSNNFFNWKEEIQTPLLLWASKDDMIVNNRLNSGVVEASSALMQNENIGVLNLPYGNHCGFSTAYGAQASAAVLRTFVLNNSPEFVDSYDNQQTQDWTFGFDKLGSTLLHVNQKWTFTENSKHVKVDFKLFNSRAGKTCSSLGPWKSAPEECYVTKTKWLPISALKNLGARVPNNQTEAQALTREFNTKVEFRVKFGPLSGTNKSDFFMSWRNYFE